MDELTTEVSSIAKIPTRSAESATKRAKINCNDTQSIQCLYRRIRRGAIRVLMTGEGESCEVNIADAETHFSRVWAPSDCDTTLFQRTEGCTSVPTGIFSKLEVSKRLKNFENTAPRDDGLTYHHWRRLDPACSLLTEILNTWIRHRRVPPVWKRAVTILIYKKGYKQDISNWRPISLCRTIYKLYTGCLANRLTE